MRTDRKLITATILILFLQIFLLMADVGAHFFVGDDDSDGVATEEIGLLISKKQNVKRRSQGSVVWEESETADVLMTYDSLLTLENSSAHLKLRDDVKINLHENTLIVLEPPDVERNNSLRVRFSRGDLLSQTRHQRLQVGSGDWQIDARPGTDISLKSLENNQVEVEVAKGAVDLFKKSDPSGIPKTIEKGTRFTMSKSEIENEQKISDDLKFIARNEERVYTHGTPVNYVARWHGAAERIRLIGPDKKTTLVDVTHAATSHDDPDVHVHSLQFNMGTHYLSLKSGERISAEVLVRVLPAPRIKYTSPLPRERFEVGSSALFSWIPVEGAAQYEIELTNLDGERERLPSEPNIRKAVPKIEGETQMRVSAQDTEGFRIPPFYGQTLYFVRDPLAPPKLLVPSAKKFDPIRAPTNAPEHPAMNTPTTPATKRPADSTPKPVPKKSQPNGASLFEKIWLLVIGKMAWAEDVSVRQITFGWFDVQGADFYNIEISSEKNFASPEVLAKVKTNSFQWAHYKKQIYYWRVAAGADSGRMGLFSDVAEVDLSKIDSLQEGEIAPGVQLIIVPVHLDEENPKAHEAANTDGYETATGKEDAKTLTYGAAMRQRLPPKVTVEPAPVQAASPPALPPAAHEVPDPLIKRWQQSIFWNLQYVDYSYEEDFDANLIGLANLSFSSKTVYTAPSKNTVTVDAQFAKIDWQAESEKTWPYQKDFSSTDWSVLGLYRKPFRDISFGAYVSSLTTLKRVALENVTGESSILVGGALGMQTVINSRMTFNTTGTLGFNDKITALGTRNELNYTFSKYFIVGGDLHFLLYFGDGFSGSNLQAGFHFGVGW